MRYVNSFSTGVTSWAAGRRIADEVGAENVTHVFCNTRIEDEDNYRFMAECMADLGGMWVVLQDGRTPWEVMKDARFVGNSRVDPCSKILKREIFDKWLRDNCEPQQTTLVMGYDCSELDRMQKFKARAAEKGCLVRAPLTEKPAMFKDDAKKWAASRGLRIPRLYEMGFSHANCGGFCVKAGKAHFKRLLEHMPDRYKHHEQQEQMMRDYLGKDVTILRTQVNKKRIPLTLAEYRGQLEAGKQFECDDVGEGGCGCFTDFDDRDQSDMTTRTLS